MLSDYLANDPLQKGDNKVSEVEMRFGNKNNSISKIDYDNVAQTLRNNGFVPQDQMDSIVLELFLTIEIIRVN